MLKLKLIVMTYPLISTRIHESQKQKNNDPQKLNECLILLHLLHKQEYDRKHQTHLPYFCLQLILCGEHDQPLKRHLSQEWYVRSLLLLRDRHHQRLACIYSLESLH